MRVSTSICTVFACVAMLVLAGISLWWAPLNQDEGWYLMASQRISEDALPYRDFFFTQPPVLPYVYQLARPLVAWQGVAGGRGFTLLLSLVSLGLLWTSLRRFTPAHMIPLASLILVCLLGLNPTYLQYSTTVKTYALGALWLLLALTCILRTRAARPLAPLLSGVFAALAIGTRLSLLPFALVFLIGLFRKRTEQGPTPTLAFLGGTLITGGIIFLPLFLQAPDNFLFGLWGFHQGRLVENRDLIRTAFVLRWFRGAFPVLLPLGVLLTQWPKLQGVSKWILFSALGTTLIHLGAPFPYDEYQVVIFPLLCWVVATEAPRLLTRQPSPRVPAVLLAGALAFTGSSPVIEGWFAGERDRLWWPMKEQSDLATLRYAAEQVQELDPDGTVLCTPDTYLAIEAGRDVPSGLEMGTFSFFPEFTTEQATDLQVLNLNRISEILQRQDIQLIAISEYGFSISSPSLTPTSSSIRRELGRQLQEEFTPGSQLQKFGQQQTRLRFYTR